MLLNIRAYIIYIHIPIFYIFDMNMQFLSVVFHPLSVNFECKSASVIPQNCVILADHHHQYHHHINMSGLHYDALLLLLCNVNRRSYWTFSTDSPDFHAYLTYKLNLLHNFNDFFIFYFSDSFFQWRKIYQRTYVHQLKGKKQWK